MNKYLTISASTVLLFVGLFSITGCSSSDSAAPGIVPATVPANATVIDDTNAEPMIAAIASSRSALGQVLAVETTPVMGLNAALDIVKPMIKNRTNNTGIALATGGNLDEGGACDVDGTYSIIGDETGTDPNFTETTTATFTGCDDGIGFIIDGSLSATFTENISTGEYTDNVSGTLSITIVSTTDTVKVSFTGLAFEESGNNLDFTYTTTKSTFALVIVVNGTTQFAFLAELSAPIVESNGEFCPESGHILVTGGNGTTAEGIYNGDTTMTIIANGTVLRTDAPCY